MGEGRDRDFREGWSNSEECFSMGQSNCDSAQEDEPWGTTSQEDVRRLQGTKLFAASSRIMAHSKAKGILTLVPIPKIDEIYAKLEGSTIYSTFDMRSGYYHLELTPESQAKSAFVVGGPRGGKWEFKRCSFGLTQAPAYFQLLVSKVIEGLLFAFGYLDDILVFSSGVEEHLKHVREVFVRLREADLKLSKRKCCFLKAHVQYLGHYISGAGLEPVPEKLDFTETDASAH